MANPTPQFRKLILARTIWLDRTHIAGEAVKEGEPRMRVGRKGEKITFASSPASDLIIQENAVEDKPANNERIAQILEEVKSDSALKKAA